MTKSNTCDKVYNYICHHQGLSTYEISKRLNMSGGRVRYALSRLHQMGLVKFKFERNNPRIRKLTYPVPSFKLLSNRIKRELRGLKSKI